MTKTATTHNFKVGVTANKTLVFMISLSNIFQLWNFSAVIFFKQVLTLSLVHTGTDLSPKDLGFFSPLSLFVD